MYAIRSYYASELHADKLVFITEAGSIRDTHRRRIYQLTLQDAKAPARGAVDLVFHLGLALAARMVARAHERAAGA